MLANLTRLYFKGLPYTLSLSTGVGIANSISHKNIDFKRMGGNISVGILVGILYPLSFPAIVYTFLDKK